MERYPEDNQGSWLKCEFFQIMLQNCLQSFVVYKQAMIVQRRDSFYVENFNTLSTTFPFLLVYP